MKPKNLLKYAIAVLVVFLIQSICFDVYAQTDDNQIIFLRPKRGMGQGVQHVLVINKKEVGRLNNSSMLTYTLKEEGEYDLLITMYLVGSPAGTPFAQKVKVAKGNPVYVDLRVTYAKVAEVIDDKKAEKLIKKCSYKTEASE